MAKKKGSKATRAGRGNRLAWGVLLLLILVIGWGPTIVAKTSLRQRLVAWGAGDFKGEATIGSASIGWLTPIELHQVTVVDEQGKPLLEADRITCDRNLWQLISDRQDLGVLAIENPHLHCTLRADGSNLEDALAPFFASESDAPLPGIELVIKNGVIDLVDSPSNETWKFASLSAALTLPVADETVECKLAGSVQRNEEAPGEFDAAIAWSPAAAGIGAGEAKLTSRNLPLDAGNSLLRRFGQEIAAAGRLTSDATYQWEDGGAEQALHVTALSGQQLSLTAAPWLGPRPVQAASLNVSGGVQWSASGQVAAKELTVDSNIGRVVVEGAANLSDLSVPSLLRLMQQDTFRVQGRFDIAQLAAAAPQLLHIRDDIRLTSGEIDFALMSQIDDQQSRRWEASLRTHELAAVHVGQAVAWKDPIRLTAIARQTPQGPAIEQLECSSTFLQASGAGTLAGGRVTATCNLDQLAAELAQFIDLSGVQLGGVVEAESTWRRESTGPIAIEASAIAQKLRVAAPGIRPWQEDRLSLAFSAAGQATMTEVTRLDTAALRVQSAEDVLTATLLAPVAQPQLNSSMRLKCELSGELSRWADRLQSLVSLKGWQIGGQATAAAEGEFSLAQSTFPQATLAVDGFRLEGAGLTIIEPRVEATAQGQWDGSTGRLTLDGATLASSALSLGANGIVVESTDGLPKMAGKIAYRADIARTANWFLASGAAPNYFAYGSATGEMQLNHREGVTTVDTQNTVQNLVLVQRNTPPAGVTPVSSQAAWSTLWQEPQLTISGQSQYHHASDSLQVVRCNAASELLSAAAAGRITELTAIPRAELAGKINYDLEKVAVKLRPTMGEGFELHGEGVRDFTLKGPLLPNPPSPGAGQATPLVHDELTATVSLGWTSATIEGLAFGPGEIAAKLEQGVVHTGPIDTPVGNGRLRGSPRILLNANPMMLEMGPTQLLERVEISPDLCSRWLKYVAPMLADSTTAEGVFTVNLEGASFPLTNPQAGACKGRLEVHAAQVGAGPLAQQLFGTATQVMAIAKQQPPTGAGLGATRLTLKEQIVNFQVANGRVYHENLVMEVDDILVRTSGSVGFDQTLSLVAQIPVAQSWLGSAPLAQGLRGKTLEVPVQGTLARPALDSRALTNLGRQMLQGSTNQLLEQGVQRGLQQLFGPRN